MQLLNDALTPDENDGYGTALAVEPSKWPLGLHGTRMREFWESGDLKMLLVGNVLVWWAVAFSVVAFTYQSLRSLYRFKFGGEKRSDVHRFIATDLEFNSAGFWCALGWALHYLPFFWIQRTTYLHHCAISTDNELLIKHSL